MTENRKCLWESSLLLADTVMVNFFDAVILLHVILSAVNISVWYRCYVNSACL